MINLGRLQLWWNGYAWGWPSIPHTFCGCTIFDFGKVGITWLSGECATKGDDA